ncbi:hypothetical protein OQA88_4637 [Cercophora sp. LCS_1]
MAGFDGKAHYFNPTHGHSYRYLDDAEPSLRPAPKRIIICCDGTWQSSVTNMINVPSNVTRIARYLTKSAKDENGKLWQQVVYYDAGIGTGVSSIEAKRQGGTGSGFVGNVIEAYNFIVLNYNLGDQIFCIGFSRGAYTARAVAGLVTDIGIIEPGHMQDFPELYSLYQKHTDGHMFRKTQAWRDWAEGRRKFDPKEKDLPWHLRSPVTEWEKLPHGAAPESTRWVEAIGVFDTVGSLGIPDVEGAVGWIVDKVKGAVPVEDFGFHNVALSPYIKNAYHALALDEHRKPFDATLWHFPEKGTAGTPKPKASSDELRTAWRQLRDTNGVSDAELARAWEDLVAAEMYEELKGTDSKLLQVWFPGVHINIGGGSDDLLAEKKSDFEQIAIVTLAWMIEQLSPHLTFNFTTTWRLHTDRFQLMRPVVDSLLKSNNKDHWLMKKINSAKAKDKEGDRWTDGGITWGRSHAADVLLGWATGPIIDSFEGDMKRAGSKDRTPGEYKATKTQGSKTVKLGKTNEQIHPTVAYRMFRLGTQGYKPVPLKDFKRQKKVTDLAQDDGSVKKAIEYEWVKGDVRIPEYKIRATDSESSDSWERICVVSESAGEWLAKLDKEYDFDSPQVRKVDAPPPQPQVGGYQPQSFFPNDILGREAPL